MCYDIENIKAFKEDIMEVFTVAFFGNRNFNLHFQYEEKLEKIISEIIEANEYVEFLVGRNGEFDIFVSSVVKKIKSKYQNAKSALVLVLPYMTAEYKNNSEYFEKYYDEIEVSSASSIAYFKSAIQIRNREMTDRADLIICYDNQKNGGTYKTLCYAKKINKKIIEIDKY